jgi:hypothetical protein
MLSGKVNRVIPHRLAEIVHRTSLLREFDSERVAISGTPSRLAQGAVASNSGMPQRTTKPWLESWPLLWFRRLRRKFDDAVIENFRHSRSNLCRRLNEHAEDETQNSAGIER